MITLELPWPPSVNNLTAMVRGRKIMSERGRKYRIDAQAAVLTSHGLLTPIQSPVSVSIFAAPPDRRRRDLDNLNKAVLDSLVNCRVIADDSQIHRLSIEWEPIKKGGGVTVKVNPLEEA